MFSEQRLRIVVLILVLILLAHQQDAQASYFLPPEAEKFSLMVPADNWSIVKHANKKPQKVSKYVLGTAGRMRGSRQNCSYELKADYRKRSYSWTISKFLLAHHIDSNTICTGSYLQLVEQYLGDISGASPKPDLFIKLTAQKKGGPLQVAAIWPFNQKKAWNKAIQSGSRILDLSAEKVRLFETPSAYRQALLEHSQGKWKLLASRK